MKNADFYLFGALQFKITVSLGTRLHRAHTALYYDLSHVKIAEST